MNGEKIYVLPKPIIDKKEDESFKNLNERYEKIAKPGALSKTGDKVKKIVPKSVKEIGKKATDKIKEKELYEQCIKVAIEGFSIMEKEAAKLTVSEKNIVKSINKLSNEVEITSFDEICLARSYDISKIVNKYRTQNLTLALLEGGVTGIFGFAGLPFNIVLSTFLFYRAVQSVAMYYGYDVKNDTAELIIAGNVFMSAISPKSNGQNELAGIVSKIMVMTEITTIKQVSNKTWTEMANHGGIPLLLCQIRALANKAAKKALDKAGKQGLEKNIFTDILRQLGKKMTKDSFKHSMPIVGAAISGLFDTAQMNKVLEYADVFYCKRFLVEKEVRINSLIGTVDSIEDTVIDIPEDEMLFEENN